MRYCDGTMWRGQSGQNSHVPEAESPGNGTFVPSLQQECAGTPQCSALTYAVGAAVVVCLYYLSAWQLLSATASAYGWVTVSGPMCESMAVGFIAYLLPPSRLLGSVSCREWSSWRRGGQRERQREGLCLQLPHSLSPHPRTHCPQHTDTSCWHDPEI